MFAGLQNLISAYYFIGITTFLSTKNYVLISKENFVLLLKKTTGYVLEKTRSANRNNLSSKDLVVP